MTASPMMPSRRHPATTIGTALVAFLLLSSTWTAPTWAEGENSSPADSVATPNEGVWITVGSDAFASLAAVSDLRFQLEPLHRAAEASGVVLTRVHADDLVRISNELHREHRRCAGFMAHASLAEAERELARIRKSQLPLGSEYTIDQQALVQRLEFAISKPQILGAIDSLSNDLDNRYHAHPQGTAAAEWLRDEWASFAAPRPYAGVELYPHSSTNQPSVVLTIEGLTLPDEVVVLGAHLDSITFSGDRTDPDYRAPGADDDGSGVAVLYEVARLALADGFRPQRTIKIMAYAAEEVGLRGSGEIAQDFQAAGIDVIAVLQLDMTGFAGSALDVGVLSEQWTDDSLTTFTTELLDTYQPSLIWSTTACGYACSDHASWDSEGYPAAMAFEALFGEHNQTLHTTSDTLDTLGNNVDHAYKFARLAVAFMVETAKEANIDIFADGFESGTTGAWSSVVP